MAQTTTSASLVSPRPSMVLDEASLQAYLSKQLSGIFGAGGQGTTPALSVKQFSHGQSNPTYLVASGSKQYVLRKKPPGKILASAHAVEREHAVLQALAQGAVLPVPRPLLLCQDDSVLGTPFYLMEYVQVREALGSLGAWGWFGKTGGGLEGS